MESKIIKGTHVWRRSVLSIWRHLISALPPLVSLFQLRKEK